MDNLKEVNIQIIIIIKKAIGNTNQVTSLQNSLSDPSKGYEITEEIEL